MSNETWMCGPASGDYDDDLEGLGFDTSDEPSAPRSSAPADDELANPFNVSQAESGEIVFGKRPPARMPPGDAINLAAWIVASSEVDISDFEELVRKAVESS